MSTTCLPANRTHQAELSGCTPLWKRLPLHDDDGRPLRDFMMILPRLKNKPRHYVEKAIQRIECVLNSFADTVVFADYNFDLHVLLVKVKPGFGPCIDIPVAINDAVPEALLVAQPQFG